MFQRLGGGLTLSERLAERLAGARAGRIALSVFIVFLAASTIVWNLPPGAGPALTPGTSTLRHDVMVAGAPVMYALGLDQDWAVFAPPRQQVISLEARITFADGSKAFWHPPTSTGDLFGAYRDYRWGKAVETLIADANSGLWSPFAAWIARRETSPGRRPVSVALIRSFYNILPIAYGSSGRGPWEHVTYYVYRVPARQR